MSKSKELHIEIKPLKLSAGKVYWNIATKRGNSKQFHSCLVLDSAYEIRQFAKALLDKAGEIDNTAFCPDCASTNIKREVTAEGIYYTCLDCAEDKNEKDQQGYISYLRCINIDIFIVLMKKNNFDVGAMNKLIDFKEHWEGATKDEWPDKRKYTDWRKEFFAWLRGREAKK